jgi:cyclic beta-1,2-glucan synthetase
VFDLAWTHSQVLLRQLNASWPTRSCTSTWPPRCIYPNARLRAEPAIIAAEPPRPVRPVGLQRSRATCRSCCCRSPTSRVELVRQLVQAHAYWRLKGLAVDLVIWNEDRAGYRQELQDQIMGLIASGSEASLLDRPGGIFVRPRSSSQRRPHGGAGQRADHPGDSRGTLAEQVSRACVETPRAALRTEQAASARPDAACALCAAGAAVERVAAARRPAADQSGYGGFSADGTNTSSCWDRTMRTPAPWANVLANPHFGTVISESGAAYTWAENAHEFRLTPWHNDPVGDASGEAFYLRDEETGQVWSPTRAARDGSPGGTANTSTRHGFGYSVFEHDEDGIHSELWVYVALDAPVKFSVLKLRNDSGRRAASAPPATSNGCWATCARRRRCTWSPNRTRPRRAVCAQPYNTEFPGRVAFFDVDDPSRGRSAATAASSSAATAAARPPR